MGVPLATEINATKISTNCVTANIIVEGVQFLEM